MLRPDSDESRSGKGVGFAGVAEEMGLSGKSAAYRLFERAVKHMGELMDRGEQEAEA